MKHLSNFVWEEPNRANTPPLHIANSGARTSSLTGVKWLSDSEFITNHRSGLRIAYFDLKKKKTPIFIGVLPHLTDDVSAKEISEGVWEVAVSGCWVAPYSILTFDRNNGFHYEWTAKKKDHTFCHGVEYDESGALWLGLHTGKKPRIQKVNINGSLKVWKLPKPWGCRKICFDKSGIAYAIAVSNVPQLKAYSESRTSVWRLDPDGPKTFLRSPRWEKVLDIDKMHSDSGQIINGVIWLPDQLNNKLVGVDLMDGRRHEDFSHVTLDFPHGIDINANNTIAVSNYGTSNVTLFAPEA